MSLTLTPLAPQYRPEHSNGRKPVIAACDHFVQFYESDQTLVESVSEFISSGMDAGEGCIVIATAAHRSAIENKLIAGGIDIRMAQRLGTYVALDAGETLSRFMDGDSPDAEAFRQ